MTGWRALLLVGVLLGSRGMAGAQQAPRFAPSGEGPGFLTGFNVWMGIEGLSGDDQRFEWDFDTGAEIDILKYTPGRVNLLVNYEAVLGTDIQHFDPIFNNYTIDLLGGLSFGSTEFALVFHHVSRHLGDRPKPFLIAWNDLGGRVTWKRTAGSRDVQLRGWVMGVIVRHYVDYTMEAGADVVYRHVLNRRVALVGRGSIVALGVDDRSDRGTQTGGRLEAAVRLTGTGAAIEFYGAVDRRVDPDPFDVGTVTWGLVGLRITNP